MNEVKPLAACVVHRRQKAARKVEEKAKKERAKRESIGVCQ
jgi:hypothetical protein